MKKTVLFAAVMEDTYPRDGSPTDQKRASGAVEHLIIEHKALEKVVQQSSDRRLIRAIKKYTSVVISFFNSDQNRTVHLFRDISPPLHSYAKHENPDHHRDLSAVNRGSASVILGKLASNIHHGTMEVRNKATMVTSNHASEALQRDGHADDELDPEIATLIEYLYGELPDEQVNVVEELLKTSEDHREWLMGHEEFRRTHSIKSADDHKVRFQTYLNSVHLGNPLE